MHTTVRFQVGRSEALSASRRKQKRLQAASYRSPPRGRCPRSEAGRTALAAQDGASERLGPSVPVDPLHLSLRPNRVGGRPGWDPAVARGVSASYSCLTRVGAQTAPQAPRPPPLHN